MSRAVVALGGAVGLGQPGIDDQPMPVLRHDVTHVAELGFLALPFAKQARIGVGGRSVRLVRALLAVEVALGIAPAAGPPARRLRLPSFGTKLFMLAHASISVPSTEKCSLDSSCAPAAGSARRP